MPRIHDSGAPSGLVERAGRLTQDSHRNWGVMTVDQMLWHVNAQLEVALGIRPCAPIDSLFKRTIIKMVALYGPWPKGKAPTAREMKATSQYDINEERERFAGLLKQFAARPLNDPWRAHPAFGPLSGSQWSRLAWRHANFHLTQFSV